MFVSLFIFLCMLVCVLCLFIAGIWKWYGYIVLFSNAHVITETQQMPLLYQRDPVPWAHPQRPQASDHYH